MKPHQRTAIENFCRLGAETLRSFFRHRGPHGASVILTVNVGYE